MKAQRAWLPAASAIVLGAAACNMVSGADEIRISDDDGGVPVATVTTTGATTGGAGGMLGSGGTTVTVAGTGGAATTTTTTTTGAGAGPTVCEYPSGPYGVAMGDVVPPTLSWDGFEPGNPNPTSFTAEDLFDCDGSRGIHAIVVDTSQYG